MEGNNIILSMSKLKYSVDIIHIILADWSKVEFMHGNYDQIYVNLNFD
jgi:hypothetical protein